MCFHAPRLGPAPAPLRRRSRLDESLAEAHASLALVHQERFEWDVAEREFKRALELRPAYATAHRWCAAYLAGHGRAPDAMIEIRRALALDPLSLSINAQLAAILILARRYDEAIVQLDQTLQMDHSFSMAHIMLAEAYAHKRSRPGPRRGRQGEGPRRKARTCKRPSATSWLWRVGAPRRSGLPASSWSGTE